MIGTSQLDPYMVGKWQVEANTCSLFYEPAGHRFRFENTHTGQAKTFRATLYDDQYAISLISLFQQTIGINLAQETFKTVQSACFFPKLCVPIEQDPNIQVALFGYENSAEELKGLRWGVHYNITDEEQTLEVEEEETVARAFVRYAPLTNEPDLQSKTDEKGRPIPGPNHYAMHAYTQHFRLSLIQNVDQRIQRIGLNYVSLLDKKTVIDTTNYALTLISTGATWYGHAVIAIEGIEAEASLPFLWYAHLRGQGSNGTCQAEVILEKSRKLRLTSQTETWRRSKEKVEKIISRVNWEIEQQNKKEPWVFFNILGGDSKLVQPIKVRTIKDAADCDSLRLSMPEREAQTRGSYIYSIAALEKGENAYIGNSKTLFLKSKGLSKEMESVDELKDIEVFVYPDNCMTWTRRLLTLADIYLKNENVLFTTPVEYTQTPSDRSKTAKGKERFFFPFILGPYHYFIDYTDEIQRQVGHHQWKLTEESFQLFENNKDGPRGIAQLILPKLQEEIVNGNTRLTITVETNGVEQEIDLSEEFKRQYKPKLREYETKIKIAEISQRGSFFKELKDIFVLAWNDAWRSHED